LNPEIVEKDLITYFRTALPHSPYDFGISCSYRSPENQFEHYKSGRILKNGKWKLVNKKKWLTSCDGYKIKSNHNYKPARAIDIYIWHNGKMTYNKKYLKITRKHILKVAKKLYKAGKTSKKLQSGFLLWGKDRPHFQLKW
ncbi:hypothetical protein KAH94_05060, partial [bacterium]|nr:hypothetical protein [bacterium]